MSLVSEFYRGHLLMPYLCPGVFHQSVTTLLLQTLCVGNLLSVNTNTGKTTILIISETQLLNNFN